MATPPSRASRVASIDLLRGVVMVIMAIDHARDFLHVDAFVHDPTDPATTTLILFFTRWITHFCAPVFVVLAGTGVAMQLQRGASRHSVSRFLFTRGVWLCVCEATLVGFAWTFDPTFSHPFFQVIWVLGVSMIVLSLLIRLPRTAILIIGVSLVALHNLLDGVSFDNETLAGLWTVLHVQRPLALGFRTVFIAYPLIPWMGVMALGFVFGEWYAPGVAPAVRRARLVRWGVGAIVAFIVLRALNVYGDLHSWTPMATEQQTFFSFLNVTKYPPSLDYLLATLGPALLFLAFAERFEGRIARFFIVFGRVPMFYYLVHLYVLHAVTVVIGIASGTSWSAFVEASRAFPPVPHGFGFSLAIVYLVWGAVIALLYPVCRWYDRYKSAHRENVWLRYL